ncbi:MAG: sigma factor-like helix-turn-helix DNA-binding protein [Bacilli bacterium]|nr:sigma factor-like helix-turn-helix DNA-binding protein [Bacilli bacterium]
MNIIETEKINQLLDIYQDLLTPYQRKIMTDYFQEDLSLKEIAENNNISRNAVFSLIKRVEKIIKNYENKLHLLEKQEKINNIIENCGNCTKEQLVEKIKKINE